MCRFTPFVLLLVSFSIYSFPKNNQQTDFQKNKISRIYYDDGVVAIERFYGTDKIMDSIKTYHKNGKKNEFFYYKDGKLNGDCYQFNRAGEIVVTWTFKRGLLRKRIDRKIEFHKNNKATVEKAHKTLKEAKLRLKINPKELGALYAQATARYRLGNFVLALSGFKYLETYIENLAKNFKSISPKVEANVYDCLGTIYASYELENTAIHYKLKAIKTSPEQSRLYHNLGSYLFQLNCHRLAIAYLNRAKEFFPNHAFANWLLSAIYTDLEQYDLALQFNTIAFEREKNINKLSDGRAEIDVKTIRGFLYHKLGDSEKGIEFLEEALELNQNNSFALRSLGIIYHDLEEYNTACDLLQKAKTLGYEKIHDRDDLNYYLDYSCENKTDLAQVKFIDKPFVYPNPTTDIITVKNIQSEEYAYALFDYNGRLISEGISKNKAIDISRFIAGLYVMNINDNGQSYSFKIIKQ